MISSRIVITAAHCVFDQSADSKRAGYIFFGGGPDTNWITGVRGTGIAIHPYYNSKESGPARDLQRPDIALVYLEKPQAGPWPTLWSGVASLNSQFTGIGYGQSVPSKGSSPNDGAGKKRIGTFTVSQYLPSYSANYNGFTPQGTLTNIATNQGQIVVSVSANKQRICPGDSGGPLLGAGTAAAPGALVGIAGHVEVPNGLTCTDTGNEYYTAVSAFLPWIRGSMYLESASNNEALVRRLYLDVLGRQGEESAVQTWKKALDSGRSSGDITSSFLRSDEYLNREVADLYRQYLLREPDPGGHAEWVRQLRNGARVESIIKQFVISQEYFNKAQSRTDTGILAPELPNVRFIRAVYFDVLGRIADSDGLSRWNDRLQQNADRGAIVDGFTSSGEYRNNLVRRWFEQYLRRQPLPTELSDYAGRFGTSTVEDVQAQITATDWYRNLQF